MGSGEYMLLSDREGSEEFSCTRWNVGFEMLERRRIIWDLEWSCSGKKGDWQAVTAVTAGGGRVLALLFGMMVHECLMRENDGRRQWDPEHGNVDRKIGE